MVNNKRIRFYIICSYTNNVSIFTSKYSEKKISTCSSHYENMVDNYALGRGQFELRVMIGSINEGDYYKSSGPHGLREDMFFCLFSYCMTMGDDDPRGVANLDPRGMIGRIYVGYYLTLLHT